MRADQVVSTAQRSLRRLEEIDSLGLPESSEELTDLTDPVRHDIHRLVESDRAARAEIVTYLGRCESPMITQLLRGELGGRFGVEPGADRESVQVAGVTVPASPAVFLGVDLISVPEKKLRRLKELWRRPFGWFFGLPQVSAGLKDWPVGSNGKALDFMVQVNLPDVAGEVVNFGSLGLPDDLVIQVFIDLGVPMGLTEHRVVVAPVDEMKKRLLDPPSQHGFIVSSPVLVSPVTAFSIPRADDPLLALDDVDRDFYPAVQSAADEGPYRLNPWGSRAQQDSTPFELGYLSYVPMARIGGFIQAPAERWEESARAALGCEPSEMLVLYDGPIEPEPQPVGDPDRLRLLVLIERARLADRDVSRTFAIQY